MVARYKELTTLPVLRYGSGHRKCRLKILSINPIHIHEIGKRFDHLANFARMLQPILSRIFLSLSSRTTSIVTHLVYGSLAVNVRPADVAFPVSF